ncbi:hypothetical protein SARC_08567 [Sphaeroforma arctica JP610]|uniref:Redoxin domain-containing protein n=1 Tax=Sphaeroforma arctica JP610 TaxID=667725 RepID=A0A0L0FR55_9EUKA|nr:hypothetical protein SARC_08567 [Sphaeroforma arctica JP610]KNC79026.1 hypothetical protein SARC_08567 [Sphaeroforma arctica JP610]|eukprot:XP_014152928.1 hypothetical protein SARC_08567 [Sphaeroforma arctica JP610]
MDIKPEIEKAGAQLVAIGTGNQMFAKGFVEGVPFTGDVYRDPPAATFKAMNLTRLGYWEVMKRFFFNLSSLSWSQENKEKYPTSNMEGDGLQTGAVYVIATDGTIKYQFIENDNEVDVFADTEAIKKALLDL